MKYLLAAFGALVAFATYRHAPDLFRELVGASGWSSAFLAVGALLTSGWALALGKLSSLEKLDDLPAYGVEKIGDFSAGMRSRIIVAIIINTLLAAVSVISIYLAGVTAIKTAFLPVVGYVLCATIGFWVGGLVESWSCYTAIENTRRALGEAQQKFKQRISYLTQLRKDITEKPVNMKDPHLAGYTSDVTRS
jgi:hypothetical protein